jgi:hypothetical protein
MVDLHLRNVVIITELVVEVEEEVVVDVSLLEHQSLWLMEVRDL